MRGVGHPLAVASEPVGVSISPTGSSVQYGANIVTNGNFDSNTTGWTEGVGWTWNASGYASFVDDPESLEPSLDQNLTTVVSTVYRVRAFLNIFVGPMRVDVGGATVITQKTVGGVYSGTFVGTGSDLLEFVVPGSGTKIVAVDNVTVQPIL